jgi:hypothetical protein
MSIFDAKEFLHAVTNQDATELREYFAPHAVICWHNSNELFTVEEYLCANCEYPGSWNGEVERVEVADLVMIIVAKIWSTEFACRVASFLEFAGDKISRLDEYWGDIGDAPQWRKDMRIGKAISE